MKHSPLLKILIISAACVMIAAACSSDSSDESAADEGTTTTTAPAEDPTEEATEAPTEEATEAPTEEATEAPTEEATETPSQLEGELVGVFAIDPASCEGAEVSGSYFRMIQPEGDLAAGPFVPNGDTTCADPTYTALAPGTDGGLVTGVLQSAPDPPFDEAGNGLADAITEPTLFFGVGFAVGTEEDGNTPMIAVTDGELSGDLSAWTAFYGDLVFLQGAPLPDGSLPGLTTAITGTIDADTGEYVLEWSSQIDGGAFNEFTGLWHLEGTFEAS